VDVVLIEVERHRDKKSYPTPWPVPPDEAQRVRDLVHAISCSMEHPSIRRTQQLLLSTYGIRRSRGRVHAILRDFECPRCHDGP
jgi:hypothetical protein